MPSITPRFVIDSARSKHWSFTQTSASDGAAMLYLQTRARTHLAQYGNSIEGLVGTALEYQVPLTQPSLLVTESGSVIVTDWTAPLAVTSPPGFPAVGLAYADGWPVSVDGGGHYYVDFSKPPIAGDPFALNGGVPGFPLPPDMIRLTVVTVTMNEPPYPVRPCFIVPETQRLAWPFREKIGAFLATNRLMPIRPPCYPVAATDDLWSRVASITISYVGIQRFSTLDDIINFPAVLVEVLIADVAGYFAVQSKDCPQADREGFLGAAKDALAMLADPAHLALYQGQQPTSVRYRPR